MSVMMLNVAATQLPLHIRFSPAVNGNPMSTNGALEDDKYKHASMQSVSVSDIDSLLDEE